ncbi:MULTISPECIES: cation:proton antiporter family protein [Pseudoalteromonas]|uniref:cation:proton antiporter family protein n=1 Tax=Pseudoalteromonas TaxID=53246 RepID=UPI0006DC4AF2|nr:MULTISPECIES: cation:proton antiporter family protein [Pseudoalteromonas]KPW04831.1 Glutathione-regulated potassium-efflux system protein KefC [Pseudoalteromonas sp. P1-8]MDK9682486.1 cation:proton antiporter [Pseudoalteromonas shioyasakiensis]
MELIYFATAFVCGFAVYQLKLPPLIGFLLAGFALNLYGYKTTELLNTLASLGVTLLLFSIGLKLKVSNLMKPQVWAPASMHIVLSSTLFSGFMLLLGALALPLFNELSWQSALLVGFAFSFSSTVFAVKVLEERGEMASLHGKIAIGILVMQDIFAVIFLAISTGKAPNIWALALLVGLPILRPVMFWVLNRSKHGELLPLFGFFFALVMGYQAFEFAGLKGDLGALIIGMMFASHKKAGELSKSLLNLKDVLLVGFFLNIGLNAELTSHAVIVALIIILVLPVKVALYYVLTNAFKLRARTSLLSAFSLANYSEFGLIVCAVAATSNLITSEWLAVMAIAVSITFILASPLNKRSNEVYVKIEHWLLKFESNSRLAEELPVNLNDTKIVIFGMGRIGTGAYETISQTHPNLVAGIDIKPDVVDKHIKRGRRVLLADATDPDFWQRVNHSHVGMVMLAMPKHMQNIFALEQLRASGYEGQVTAIANYPDQQKELEDMGVDSTYNFYLEAGSGFAEHVKQKLFS